MKNIVLIAGMLMLLVSCKKETEEQSQESEAEVVLNLLAPTENQTYQFGDTVRILGTISSTSDLHGYNLRLNHPIWNMFVINKAFHEHGTSFIVNEYWVNTVSDTTQLKLIFDVAIDHEGNLRTFEKFITCFPQ